MHVEAGNEFDFDAAVDGSGTLLISNGSTFALDAATGAELWTLEDDLVLAPLAPLAVNLARSLSGVSVTGPSAFRFFLATP